MPRPRPLKPSYCFDKSSGRAFVTLNGTRKYLGPHGTQASRDEYDRAIGEWIAAGRQGPVARGEQHDGPTVSTVFAAFWSHAQGYYRLRRLYGASSAAAFGPLCTRGPAARDDRVGLVPHTHQPPDQSHSLHL